MPIENSGYMCANAQNGRKHGLIITLGIFPPGVMP